MLLLCLITFGSKCQLGYQKRQGGEGKEEGKEISETQQTYISTMT